MCHLIPMFLSWYSFIHIKYRNIHLKLNENKNEYSLMLALSPLTTGAVHISFLHFILAHYISAFKLVKDKK